MKLTVIGCSDAFGTGGRLQTCYHVNHAGGAFLIDCGATALIGLQRTGIDPNGVSDIFISHLHGDHFAGLIWWVLHANYVCRRTAPLTVHGPASIEARFVAAAEALFPGCTATPRKFLLRFAEYAGDGLPREADGVRVTPFEVRHPSGAPPYALRFETGGKVLGFSGDTEWVDNLVRAATGADLYITECFGFDHEARYHMNWRTIEANLGRFGARRVMLTHMGPDMLPQSGTIRQPGVLIAEDGLSVLL